jgi:hypothetical protein
MSLKVTTSQGEFNLALELTVRGETSYFFKSPKTLSTETAYEILRAVVNEHNCKIISEENCEIMFEIYTNKVDTFVAWINRTAWDSNGHDYYVTITWVK